MPCYSGHFGSGQVTLAGRPAGNKAIYSHQWLNLRTRLGPAADPGNEESEREHMVRLYGPERDGEGEVTSEGYAAVSVLADP